MKRAVFRFYAELNDFLPVEKRARDVVRRFDVSASVKDSIEALGVPHTEVELIVVNSAPAGFAYTVRHGDRVAVYPAFHAFPLPPEYRLRPLPSAWSFAADNHLGRLASYLRMAGFDALYRNDYDDANLAHISSSEGRILLTRDRGLLKRGEIIHGYFVRETEPKRQLSEVLKRFELCVHVRPFCRCIRCNAMLEAVTKQSVQSLLPRNTDRYYEKFARCPSCSRIYWEGSHYQHMRSFLAAVLSSAQEPLSSPRS